METKKSRVFTKKLIALFLSVLMALSCFTGALTAFAASVESDKKYSDKNLAANFMAWAETTDEQTAEALLDYADLYIGDLLGGLLGSDHLYFSQNVVITTIKIDAYLDSIDGLFDLLRQANGLISSFGGIIGGDVKNISFAPIANLKTVTSGEYVVSKCGKSYRGANSAKEMIMALAETLYKNSNDFQGKNVIGQFVKGKLSLGSIVEGILKGNVYGLLQDALGMWNGYENDVVYNIVSNLILSNTKWFDEATTADYYSQLQSGKRTSFVLDDILFDALNRELLQKISVLVTYPTLQDGVYEENGNPMSHSSYTLAKANGYKPLQVLPSGIVYSDEFLDDDGVPMNVYLFQYDKDGNGSISADEKLTLSKDDNLFSFAFDAFEYAWNTVLKDTLGLVHVNYDVDRGNGGNFDNQFYFWMTQEGRKWNTKDWKANYSKDNVEAWAADVFEDYDAASAEEFLANVKHTFDYDRNVKEDGTGNWRDIDATTLFTKLRYNPLADLYFNMQTGPINLYFMQTGIDPIATFFDTAFDKYDNMVAGLNDALVAATDILFMNRDNIGYGSVGKDGERKPATALTVPTMKKTGNTIDKSTIADTLVSNIMDMFEYAANAADANILNQFYVNNGIGTLVDNLSESNFEEAMIPLLVTCVNQIGMTKPIHDTKWDTVVDAEGAAVIALEEYLSYVLPDKDYTPLWQVKDGKLVANDGENLFDNAVLPMVRDAVSYLIQSIIPVRDGNGDAWNVYEREVNDPTTIFQILNSVVIYYGSTDGYGANTTNANGITMNNRGKAVAALLGAVDGSGNNLVSKNNDLWANIDAVANKLLPILGVFQYGDKASFGKFSSKDLIWNDLVEGILNIGEKRASGKQGITNIIERLITIITASPVSENYSSGSLTVMIYDILADEINTIFGARYDGQGYTKVIPNSEYYDRDNYDTTKSSAPFDSLLTVGTLGNYSATKEKDTAAGDGYATGVLGILICNIYEIFGGGGYSSQAANGAVWTGAMFAVQAVNNFIPSFVPQLSDHAFNAATAKVADPAQSGLTAGSAFKATTLDITNNSKGLNRFYKDANGNIAQMGRYFMDVTNITATNTATGAVASNITVGSYGVIAPGKTAKISLTGTAPSAGTTYALTITYDVYMAKEGEGKTTANTKFSGLKTTAYIFLTNEIDWQATVYPEARIENGIHRFPSGSTFELTSASRKGTYTHTTAATNNLYATIPNDFIVKMSDPDAISTNGIRVRNTSYTSAKAYDGVITYIAAGTEYYPVVNQKTVTIAQQTYSDNSKFNTVEKEGVIQKDLVTQGSDNNNVAYAAIDPLTGDLLNYKFYDYSIDGGKTWNRKATDGWTYGKHGYTASELQEIKDAAGDVEWQTRPHHVLTLEEALAAGIVYGVKRNAAAADENGNISYVYDAVFIKLDANSCKFKPDGSSESVNTLLLKGGDSQDSINWGTPTPGLYLDAGKTEVSRNSSIYTKFIVYDGTTELHATDYQMPVNVWRTSGNTMNGSIHMYICDDAAANSLGSAYNAAVKNVSTYMPSDMDDFADESSAIYDDMQTALADAVTTMGTPIRADNAGKIGSKTESTAVTNWTTSESHKDLAYAPISISEALPAAIQVSAVKGGDGYWYANSECTLPIYSNVALTDDDVTDGKDATGAAVVEVEGKYHLANAPVYKTAWDTTTYAAPYRATTSDPETNEKDEPYYAEISFVYRDAKGEKCTSADAWAYKLAEQHTTIVPNDGTENRGIFQQGSDKMDYYLEIMKGHINATVAEIIGKGVKEAREGMNNVNYEVASYEKMVQVAKDAESLIWTDEDGNYVTDHSSLEIQVAKDMYDTYMGFVKPREYIADNTGAKLEAEILCASGATYDKIDVTPITEPNAETSEEEIIAYDVTIDGVALDGTNEEGESYTADSWRYFTWALGNAVTVAKAAHAGDTTVNTNVSNLYTLRTDLMSAENGLTIDEGDPTGDGITISGQIVVATDLAGEEFTGGVAGINVMVDGEVVATSEADGSFTAVVPAGTTELTIAGETTINRTVTLSGTADVEDAVIPVIICDYNNDGFITTADAGYFVDYLSGSYYVYADLNADTFVTTADAGFFVGVLGTVNYADIALD